jgi:hypothetical protein
MPELGCYSKEISLAKLDGRTRQARLLKQVRQKLINQCGGPYRLTAGQRTLIERCAMLQLKCAMLDKKLLDGTFTPYDNLTYLAWTNSLARSLVKLGLEPAIWNGKTLDLKDIDDAA